MKFYKRCISILSIVFLLMNLSIFSGTLNNTYTGTSIVHAAVGNHTHYSAPNSSIKSSPSSSSHNSSSTTHTDTSSNTHYKKPNNPTKNSSTGNSSNASWNMVNVDAGNHTNYSNPNNSSTKSNSSNNKSSSSHSSTYVSHGSSHSNSSSHGSPLGGIIVIVILIIIIVVVIKKFKNKGSTTESSDLYSNENTDAIENAIRQVDVLFSTEDFIGWSKEVFMTIQEAWTERDWTKIRPFEKEELFNVHEKQLDEYKRLGKINMVERISIENVYLHGYERDAQYEYLTVYLAASFNDYIIDENTREVIEGDKETRYNSKYLMTFMRKLGVKTDSASSKLNTKQCPHCGAPVQITSAGKCEYCDTIITTGDHDWVLCEHTSITPDTILTKAGVHIQ